eukprot:scaffold205_cov83-Skeletonema_dohrnii-CCMP3373.AAC.2
MNLKRKDSQMTRRLKPRNKAINKKTPSHVFVSGLDDLMGTKNTSRLGLLWFGASKVLESRRIFTKEDQTKETLAQDSAALYRKLATCGLMTSHVGAKLCKIAMRSVDNAHRAAAVAVETTYYRPTHQTTAVATGVPFHGALTISMNEFAPYNSGGGRSRSGSGRRADKPTVTITAASRAEAYKL